MSYLISICIPTYRRNDALFCLIDKLASAFVGVADLHQIELIIVDNDPIFAVDRSSKLQHLRCLLDPKVPSMTFSYYCNPLNIGAELNIMRCVSLARGDYVWILTDDDQLEGGGLIDMVILLLRKRMASTILLGVNTHFCADTPLVYDSLAALLRFIDQASPLAFGDLTWIPSFIFTRRHFDYSLALAKLNKHFVLSYGVFGSDIALFDSALYLPFSPIQPNQTPRKNEGREFSYLDNTFQRAINDFSNLVRSKLDREQISLANYLSNVSKRYHCHVDLLRRQCQGYLP